MTCFCHGGPTCCMRQNAYPVPGPFKCPDCGVWWSGYSHVCLTPGTSGPLCTCPKGNYVGDIICARHYPGTTTTGTSSVEW